MTPTQILERSSVQHVEEMARSRYLIGERTALRRMSQAAEHPHVVPLIEEMHDQQHHYLVLPYMDGGKLSEQIRAHSKGVTEHDACRYLLQVIAGLRHLKQHDLAHG